MRAPRTAKVLRQSAKENLSGAGKGVGIFYSSFHRTGFF